MKIISFRSFANCSSALLVATVLLFAQEAEKKNAPASDAVEFVKQGRQLANQGKHDEALALYKKALASSPNLYDAHLATGMALDLKGEYAEARKHLQRAIKLAPAESKSQALRTMSMSYAFERKPKDAEKYHKQLFDAQIAAQKFTDAAGTANELARIFIESGDLDGAERWYRLGHETAGRDKTLSDSNKNLWDFRWHHAQARIAARRGQHQEAQKHVQAAKTALDKANNPDQAPYFPYLTGYVAFYRGDYKTALEDLQKADQKDPFILSLLAQAYEKTGQRGKAQELYRTILTFNMHNPTNAFARPLAAKKVMAYKS